MLTTTLNAIERGTEVKVLAGDGVEPGYECKGRTFSIYNGVKKEGNADCVFASIYRLGMKKHRESFAPDEFDLIVVGEFHHAAGTCSRM
ncbi:DEAD/DEAH box helicase family protein [Paenibacillus glucanolyticus]|jgi:superfamily II DNA or RNA helicase|uniref:hypothetical protein n=1 Tax=Paenibacillus glucanolyticus TaxID=59843 RepID=UPI00128C3357|nr:hypothetical protein [Paenibacillus glucanolyticus]MPY18897.1 hypothetical protein [Paenibacillus glucanolyticus]